MRQQKTHLVGQLQRPKGRPENVELIVESRADITNSEAKAGITNVDSRYAAGFVERYGALSDGTWNSTDALERANSVGRQNVYFDRSESTGTLNDYTHFYIVRDAYIDSCNLIGPANLTSDGTQTTSTLRLGQDPDTSNGFQWRHRTIRDITFSGKLRADVAISFGADAGAEETLAGQWVIENCSFERHEKAVLKQYGNIGNAFKYCHGTNGNFFYHATGKPSGGTTATLMHIGADYFQGGFFTGFRKAAFYLDGDQTSGTGGTIMDGVKVEQNPGFGIFIKDYNNAYNPIHLRNVWFEANAEDADTYVDDPDGIAQSQIPGGAGNFTLNGARTSGGTYTADTTNARQLSFTSASDESGDTYTITGTDIDGNAQNENVTGPNATTVYSVNSWLTVTQIATNGAATGAITIGITGKVDLNDGVGPRQPRDIYLENVDMCYITNSQFRILEVKDSNVIFTGCSFVYANVEVTDNSTGTGNNGSPYMIARDCGLTNFGDDAAPTLLIESIARQTAKTGVTLRHWWAPKRTHIVRDLPGTGDTTTSNASDSETYETAPELLGDPSNLSGTVVEGWTFPTASQYVMGTSEDYTAPAGANVTTVSGNWFVCTQEIRIDSGTLGSLGLVGADNWTRSTADELIAGHPTGEWITIAVLGEIDSAQTMGNMRYQFATGSGSACTFTLGACQIVQFDGVQAARDAYNYYNDRAFYLAPEKQYGNVVTKYKTADENRTTQTLTDDNELAGWGLIAGGYYKITGHLRYFMNLGDIQFLFNFSNAPDEFSLRAAWTSQSITLDYSAYEEVATNAISVQAGVTDNAENGIAITGFFQANPTTGGTVDFQFARVTANNTTTLREGSWITIERIG